MELILKINDILNGIVWGWPMLILLLGTGILYTTVLGVPQLTKFFYTIRNTILKVFEQASEEHEGDITPFQAVSTALAATVGTGNIAGVATAIASGGPGAIFWMWISALFGMATKMSEVILSITYRETDDYGYSIGGPMYYIKNGLGFGWLASTFAFFGMIASFGIGNMTQSNSVAVALNTTYGLNKLYVGIGVSILAGIVIIGGIARIAKFTAKLVPLMATLYIVGALFIIFLNIKNVPSAFAEIFRTAFSPRAALGGGMGIAIKETIKFGIARGVFTNEAGLGSAPIAHAAAQTDHPVRQGLWGIFEVFADTIMICTLTALVIIVTGQAYSGLTGAELTTKAFQTGFVGGGHVVTIGLTLFAFSTILGWEYYGEKCFQYIFGRNSVWIYRLIYIPIATVGAVGGLQEIWHISDTLNGLMAIPNLVGVLLLMPVVVALIRDFFRDPDRKRTTREEYLSAIAEKYKKHLDI